MAKLLAGDEVKIVIDGKPLTVKIEDGSKSDTVLAKVLASDHDAYHADQVCSFDRQIFVTAA